MRPSLSLIFREVHFAGGSLAPECLGVVLQRYVRLHGEGLLGGVVVTREVVHVVVVVHGAVPGRVVPQPLLVLCQGQDLTLVGYRLDVVLVGVRGLEQPALEHPFVSQQCDMCRLYLVKGVVTVFVLTGYFKSRQPAVSSGW